MLGNLNLFNRIKQEKLEKADEQVLLLTCRRIFKRK